MPWVFLAGSVLLGLGRKPAAKPTMLASRQGRQNPWPGWQLNQIVVLVRAWCLPCGAVRRKLVPCLPATLKLRFIRRFGGGVFNHSASVLVSARAAEHAVKLLARDRSSSLPPANQAIKFVPAYGLHRTPLTGRRLLQRYTD